MVGDSNGKEYSHDIQDPVEVCSNNLPWIFWAVSNPGIVPEYFFGFQNEFQLPEQKLGAVSVFVPSSVPPELPPPIPDLSSGGSFLNKSVARYLKELSQ